MNRGFPDIRRIAALLFLLTGMATPASPDWLFTPYLGTTLSSGVSLGGLGDFVANFEDRKLTYGGTATWMGGGVIGFELDFGYTPDFFALPPGRINLDFGDNSVTTLMGNLVVGIPVGGQRGLGIRPYGSAGLGLLRSQLHPSRIFNDLSTNELGVNFGGGVHVFFTDNVGIRGDLRFFRALDRNGESLDLSLVDFDFWRATAGVTFRFGP